ncbi:MAG: sulfite exporter TauE/SafE family protein [Gemmatimonadota bacterium]
MLWPVLAASLLGSAHCAGIGGAFAAMARGPERRLAGTFGYHAGRLAVDAGLGAAAGALGLGVDLFGQTAGVPSAAARIAGALLVCFGVLTLLRLAGYRGGRLLAPVNAYLARLGARAGALAAGPRGLLLGAATALLPCGWLYAFVAVAGGTGSPIRGALAMAVFWSGTVPAVAMAAAVLQRLTGALRSRLPALTAAALIVVGLLTAFGRVGPGHGRGHAPGDLPPVVAHDQLAR